MESDSAVGSSKSPTTCAVSPPILLLFCVPEPGYCHIYFSPVTQIDTLESDSVFILSHVPVQLTCSVLTDLCWPCLLRLIAGTFLLAQTCMFIITILLRPHSGCVLISVNKKQGTFNKNMKFVLLVSSVAVLGYRPQRHMILLSIAFRKQMQ